MKIRKIILTVLLAVSVTGCMAMGSFAEEAPETDTIAEAGSTEASDSTAETEAAGLSELVASADEMTTVEDIVTDDMEPVYADALNEGTYSIDVLSSSSMFKIIDCQLTVADGEMTALITLNGDGYEKLYMGTGEEAVGTEEEEYITYELNDEGKQTYEVPVEALDKGINCTAWSKRKEKWYDRVLVFSAASLPLDAYQESVMVTAEELGLEDGSYSIEVTLEGGSGKASVDSPAALCVEGGQVTAVITFSSPYYDYVLVNEERYEPVNEEGNSSFELPVSGFDWKMPVTADTTAMSTPHEIDYTLYFDSTTLEKVE